MERIISFQSREVVDILLRGDVYVPDLSKCREPGDYSEVGGAKVWVFHFPNLTQSNFYDGTIMHTCQEAMAIPGKWGLTQYYMIEMMVDASRLSVPKWHTACPYVEIMDTASLSDVVAIYTVHPTSIWYFTQLKPFAIIQADALFPDGINPLYYYCWSEYCEANNLIITLDSLRREYSKQDFQLLCDSLVSLIIKER